MLLLPHVSREGFFFISACMLTYAYADLGVGGLRRYYGRRCLSVVIPYLCWTVIYFLYGLPTSHYASLHAAFKSLAHMAYTGYYQLYFLLVIMQFYLVFPLVLMLLRRTRGHHGRLIAAAALAQVAVSIMMHWDIFPTLMIRYGQQDALSYLLYLIGGGVVAFHLEDVHRWVCGHARLIIFLTVVAALAAEGIYFLAQHGVTTVLGSGNDPFQPSVIPFNVGAIACGYLAGVALVRPGRSRRTQAMVRSGSDGLARHLPDPDAVHHRAGLVGLGPPHLDDPVAAAVPADRGDRLRLRRRADQRARQPLAVPLTGRKQQPWSTLLPRRRAPDRFIPNGPPSEQTRTDQAPTLAGVISDQNGARP